MDNNYISHLKNKEIEQRGFTCVPNVVYSNRDKFLYGSVLQVDGINYFVPISSRTGKNPQYNLDIKTDDKTNRIKGSLRFLYMIPVPTKCLVKLNINDISDSNEKARISKELAFCRRNKDKIEKYAKNTYNDVINKTNDKLVNNSCDFKLLEQAYIEYCKEHGINIENLNTVITHEKAAETENPRTDINEMNDPDYIEMRKKGITELTNEYLTLSKELDDACKYLADEIEMKLSDNTEENRNAIMEYINYHLQGNEINESGREILTEIKNSISEIRKMEAVLNVNAEDLKFISEINKMKRWSEDVREKIAERLEQQKDDKNTPKR